MPKQSKELYTKLIRRQLYWELVRGRRTSKGKRWLNPLWPTPAESRLTFFPRFAYLNYIGPGDEAGHHFHKRKKEFFCPIGDLIMLLFDKKTKKTLRIRIGNRKKKEYTMYYIPPNVPHAVLNDTKKWQALLVLTNESDIFSKTTPFTIPQ
ncbi:MAG: cupin domain-containing protein [Patescibacteria group bacterium]